MTTVHPSADRATEHLVFRPWLVSDAAAALETFGHANVQVFRRHAAEVDRMAPPTHHPPHLD